jgi:hypothetical protein
VVASHVGAGVIRAMYGTGHIDTLWAAGRRASARSAGVKALGIYQYIRADQDAVAQARALVALVGSLSPGEFLIGDLEEGAGNQLSRANAWLAAANKLTYKGYNGSWIYSGANFAATHGLTSLFNNTNVPTWIAAYGGPEPSLGHSLWQHSNGQIGNCAHEPWPGAGFVDCSSRSGGLNDLLNRIYDAGGATPPPTEDDMANITITREDFTRQNGSVPITLATGQDNVRFFSNADAILRVDPRDGTDVTTFTVGYSTAHAITSGANGIVVHRDDPTDTGTNDVSVAIW